MTESLGALLTGSYHFLVKQWKPILFGALLFAALMTAAQILLVNTAMDSVGAMGGRMGDAERMEELADRMEAGDPTAVEDMMKELGMMGDDGAVDEEAMETVATGIMKDMLPAFSGVVIVMMLLSLIASAYYIVLALDPGASFQSGMTKVPKVILPLLGVWVWAFLRSFAWIPFIGIIFAIIIGPRLACAPVILLKEKKGVMESVKSSYDRTRGYWGKIIGNGIVAGLCVWVVMMLVSVVTGILSDMSMELGMFVAALVQWLGTAYLTIFLVKLSETVLAHPLKAAK